MIYSVSHVYFVGHIRLYLFICRSEELNIQMPTGREGIILFLTQDQKEGKEAILHTESSDDDDHVMTAYCLSSDFSPQGYVCADLSWSD